MNEARDSGSNTREESGGEPGPEGPERGHGVGGGAQVGGGVVVLQEARGEPGSGSVPVEQLGRRL